MLAKKLNMSVEAAEKWIVNLIRNAKLDAKIDSQNNMIVMGTQVDSFSLSPRLPPFSRSVMI
jgi:translation initiation factor 3 subunit E